MQHVLAALQYKKHLVAALHCCGFTLWMHRAVTPFTHPLFRPLLRMKVTSKCGRFHCIIWEKLGV